MNKLAITLIALAVACLPCRANRSAHPISVEPQADKLLDSNKLSMSHSMALSRSSSYGGDYLSRTPIIQIHLQSK
jgi:hypothetical protein